jgi:anti-sigma factor RsiW
VECSETDVFHMLVAGELAPEQRARIADHAATCRTCHQLVAVLVTQHGPVRRYALAAIQRCLAHDA